MNLNLIIDEEVFFSVFGSQSLNLDQRRQRHQHRLRSARPCSTSRSFPAPEATDIPRSSPRRWPADAASDLGPGLGLGGSHPGIVANDPVSHGPAEPSTA